MYRFLIPLLAIFVFDLSAAPAAELPIPEKPHNGQPTPRPNDPPPPNDPNGPKNPPLRTLGTFPPLSPGQTEYVITQPDATGVQIERLYIPKGVTLKVAPDVTKIDWSVETFVFDENATIDLGRPDAAKPGPGPGGSPPPPQAGYCQLGSRGSAGAGGATGQPGVPLTIRDLRSIQNRGSLWIRTDAGAGGDGGAGGQGQQGGGPDNRFLGRHCNSRDGGQGGPGGPGGAGGPTSSITLAMRNVNDIPKNSITAGCATSCQPSARPPGAVGNTGVISVWGAPGCGGGGGPGGPGGLEGDRDALRGPGGGAGGPGPLGACTPVSKWGSMLRTIRARRQ